MRFRGNRVVLLGFAALLAFLGLDGCRPGSPPAARPPRPDVILATTTSTQDTGLLDYLLPMFEKETGYRVKTVAVGTGEALAYGSRGEADVLLVHAPQAEQEFLKKGLGEVGWLVMHNDFLLVGPASDPARVRGLPPSHALAAISKVRATFVSRADNSGTHKKEEELWARAGVSPGGPWYLRTGQGMGETLRIAEEKQGYTLTDRGTYLATKSSLTLVPLVEGFPELYNVYHVIVVNASRFPTVNREGAMAFARWLVSPHVQRLIGEFGRDRYGEPLFHPDAASAPAGERPSEGRGGMSPEPSSEENSRPAP